MVLGGRASHCGGGVTVVAVGDRCDGRWWALQWRALVGVGGRWWTLVGVGGRHRSVGVGGRRWTPTAMAVDGILRQN